MKHVGHLSSRLSWPDFSLGYREEKKEFGGTTTKEKKKRINSLIIFSTVSLSHRTIAALLNT